MTKRASVLPFLFSFFYLYLYPYLPIDKDKETTNGKRRAKCKIKQEEIKELHFILNVKGFNRVDCSQTSRRQ